MSHQQMNEVDEFITPALNQGLLGQPLDLAAINIARGRDVGIPTLNDFREAIGLVRYTSWTDFGQNMQHPSSLVNFIAAYAFDGSMAKAQAVFDLADGIRSATVALLRFWAARLAARGFDRSCQATRLLARRRHEASTRSTPGSAVWPKSISRAVCWVKPSTRSSSTRSSR